MLVGKPVRVRLMEPVCPESQVWNKLKYRARLFQMRGTVNTAAFVLQSADALTLARLVFGENSDGEERLSRIEEDVLARLLHALSPTLSPVCGRMTEILGLHAAAIDLLTFFEVLIEEPALLRLGIGLARDVTMDAAPLIRPEELLDVPVVLNAEVAAPEMDAVKLMGMRPGAVLPLFVPIEGSDRLMLGERIVALGTCGARGSSRAFAVTKRAA